MADQAPEKTPLKTPHAEREERILAYWKEKGIFEKTLNKNKAAFAGGSQLRQGSDGQAGEPKEFIFYEGPPTANGRPGIHHLEARAFKDALPRYKTMQGYYVRRKGGWDTHGLPVELQVEKELGLKSKKEIETYGIAAFNEKCKESVWKYVHEWEDFTNRIGYWVDLKDPYITYKPDYIESLWNIVKTVNDQQLLYKDYKVVPWCSRCGTGLSSHELAQGYEEVKDLAVTVKFQILNPRQIPKSNTETTKTYLLAWTTTPWTLPGNVALAVGAKIEYSKVKTEEGIFIVATERLESVFKERKYEVIEKIKGADLVGLEYEPLYPFLKDSVEGMEKTSPSPEATAQRGKLANAFKVYAADFVTTADGTGIVHIAPMYGQDDFELGTKNNLPKYHLVNEDGTFKKEVGFLAGKFVKAEGVDVEIIKELANRPSGSALFDKEKYTHTYPFCWRCHTPLIYFARDSWYIRMSALRDTLVAENQKINWEPAYIRDGRFGEWLSEVKDWAISRERYWGTPLPVWSCETCKKFKVVGSVADVTTQPKNTYYLIRHGEAESNVQGVLSSKAEAPHHLTEKGRAQVAAAADSLKNIPFDVIIASPFVRTQETLAILKEKLGWQNVEIKTDDRIHELNAGVWHGKPVADFIKEFPITDRFTRRPEGGENYADIKKRMGDFLYDLEKTYSGKTILIITHETPAALLYAAALGLDRPATQVLRDDHEFLNNAEIKKLPFSIVPHNPEYELDLHRPFIDEVKLVCECGGQMTRAKEVMDVWFDSGAMPFAQDHYMKEQGERRKGQPAFARGYGEAREGKELKYPADFISEAIDQTRGWFYTLHAIGILMGKGQAYKNVICLGHILDAKGKKMSKSIGNVIDPWSTMDKFGADALRYWMYSVNQPGESKNFDEKTVDEIIKKVFNLTLNVVAFYKLYEERSTKHEEMDSAGSLDTISSYSVLRAPDTSNVLDQWIIARLNQLTATVTASLDSFKLLEPTRAIRDFVADLSQWYVRRSRDRFKNEGDDKNAALATTRYVMLELAKLLAPFTPFLAEHLYMEMKGPLESVHLENWPTGGEVDADLLADMADTREMASLGLEARSAAKVNVRQPLGLLTFKTGRWTLRQKSLGDAYLDIIKDEVNVKEIKFMEQEKDVELDITITAELKEEGEVRELLRTIQDLRKENGLNVGDKASLTVGPDLKELVEKNGEQIKKATGLTNIEVRPASRSTDEHRDEVVGKLELKRV